MMTMTSIRWPDQDSFELGSSEFPELKESNSSVPKPPGAEANSLPPGKYIGRRQLWLWGSACFLLGIGFWHAVGFWSFVGTAVFGTNADGAPAAIMADEPLPPDRPAVRACTALVLDRKRNMTYSRPCEIGAAHSIRTLPLQTSYRISGDFIRH